MRIICWLCEYFGFSRGKNRKKIREKRARQSQQVVQLIFRLMNVTLFIGFGSRGVEKGEKNFSNEENRAREFFRALISLTPASEPRLRFDLTAFLASYIICASISLPILMSHESDERNVTRRNLFAPFRPRRAPFLSRLPAEQLSKFINISGSGIAGSLLACA
jgi:hypothetical protein